MYLPITGTIIQRISHITTVDGNGRDPGRKELLAVGIAAGMKKGSCEKIIDEIQTYVKQMLREYLERCQ